MKWLRADGGPVFYSYSNRTPVTGDVQMITTCLVFGTIFTAFLIIFPGVRKEVSTRRKLFTILHILYFNVQKIMQYYCMHYDTIKRVSKRG